MKKNIFCILFFLCLNILFFSYRLFYNGNELINFLNEKIYTSQYIKIVTMSMDEMFIESLENRNHIIYAESTYFDEKDCNLNIIKKSGSEGYLHEKFIIFDDNSVLFGTGNLTKNGFLNTFNIFIYTEDKKLVEVFLKEIGNFERNLYGKNKKSIYSKLSTSLGKVKFYNSPSEKVYGEILSEIKKSKEKIEIFTYSFTDPFFIYELENASFKEKNIFILSDEWNLIYNSPLKNTVSLNIKYIPGIHAKTIIIDEKVLIIGSYNFTYRAREVNDEFVLIIFNEELSQKISKKFKELWNNIL